MAIFVCKIILITILVLLSPPSAHPAPIQISGDELELSIQLDSDYTSNLYARARLNLRPREHHLVLLSDLWPMFGHLLPQMNESEFFSVVGVHSFNRNVTVCQRRATSQTSSKHTSTEYSFRSLLNGTNLGLVFKHSHNKTSNDAEQQQSLCLYNPNAENVTVLLLINLYDLFQPIPGGCNIEFELENSPFIVAKRFNRFATFDDYALDFQPGSPSPRSKFNYKSFKCNLHITGQRLRYRLYAYHDETDGDGSALWQEENYFRHLTSMSHIAWIKKNARLIAEMSHELSIGRVYILTGNSDQSRRLYFNVLLTDQMIDRTEIYEDEFYYSSLYVPVSIHGQTSQNVISVYSFEHSFNLCFVLAALALFSILVSLFGYRFFILEVFYFSFLQVFAASLCCLTTVKLSPTSQTSRLVSFIDSLNLLPSVTSWNILVSTLVGIGLSSLWTELCRRSRNIKLALSGHCMVLTSVIVAIGFDAFLVIGKVNITHFLSDSTHYVVVVASLMFAIVVLYCIFMLYLDLFWLSALSTAITTVYLILLPLDIFAFGGGILFRVLYNLWLLSFTTFTTSSGDLIVSFITLNHCDIITVILYILLASASIFWQTLTKLGNLRTYGFGCIRPNAKASSLGGGGGGDSPSSTPSTVITALSVINRHRLRRTNLNIQALQSSSTVCEKIVVESGVQSSSPQRQANKKRVKKGKNNQRSTHKHHFRLDWIKKRKHRKRSGVASSNKQSSNGSSSSRLARSASGRRRTIKKMYRCKYCHKLSHSRSGSQHHSSASHVSLRRQNSLPRCRKRMSYVSLRREAERMRQAQLESLNAVQVQMQVPHPMLQSPVNSLHFSHPAHDQEYQERQEIATFHYEEENRFDTSSVYEMDSMII